MAMATSQSAHFIRALTALTHSVSDSESEGGGDGESEGGGASTIPLFVRQAAKHALESLRDGDAKTKESHETDLRPDPNPNYPNPNPNRNSGLNSNANSNPNSEADESAPSAYKGSDRFVSGFVQDEVTKAAAVDGIGAVCEALVHLLQERQQKDEAEAVG